MNKYLVEQFYKTKPKPRYLGMRKPIFIIFCILITILVLVVFGNLIKKKSK